MNSLSWLIYLAGLMPGFIVLTRWMIAFAGAASLVALAVWLIHAGDHDARRNCEKECDAIALSAKRFLFGLLVPTFLFWTALNVLVPERQTILMIAASEMGERAIMSQTVQSVVDPATEYLRTWLQSETARLRQPGASR